MKVIHLISDDVSDAAKSHVLSLLTYLGQVADVRLVCFGEGPLAASAREAELPVTVLRHGMLQSVRTLLRLIRTEGYTFIHCHGTHAGQIGALLRPFVRVPVITTVHDADLSHPRALRGADYRICTSNPMKQALVLRDFDPGHLFTICYGLDYTREAPRVDRAALFAEYGLALRPGDVVAGTVVRPDAEYDLQLLVRAVALARSHGAQLRLAVLGGEAQRARALALADTLGIGPEVCFLPKTCAADCFFSAIDIHALPAVSDRLPSALAEGARAMRATVAFGAGDVPLFLDHGRDSFLSEPGNIEGFAAALRALAINPDLRVKMGRAIHAVGKRSLSLTAVGERQLEIYHAIHRREQWRHGSRDGVLICGAYGFGNAGDDAILEAILQEMRAIDPNMPVTVLSRRPRETRRLYGVPTMHSFNLLRMIHVLRRTKLNINGGGNLMQDVTSRMSLWYYLFTLYCARRFGAKVHMYGCGIGPIQIESDRRLAGRIMNRCADVITLREPESLEMLKAFGVDRPEIQLAADPVIRLQPASAYEIARCYSQHGLRPGGRYIAFVVRRWPGFEEHIEDFAAAAAHAYTRHGLTPVFVCINPRADLEATREATRHVTVPHAMVDVPMSAALSIGFMSRMQAVVSMRLHGLVFAAVQGVPLAGVSYDPKVRAFLDYIEQDNYVDLEDADAEKLCALIDRAVSLSGRKDELRRRAELLYARESKNQTAAARLLGRE